MAIFRQLLLATRGLCPSFHLHRKVELSGSGPRMCLHGAVRLILGWNTPLRFVAEPVIRMYVHFSLFCFWQEGTMHTSICYRRYTTARARASKAKGGWILITNSTVKSLLRGVAQLLFMIAALSFFVGD